jgi:hypothetical protein
VTTQPTRTGLPPDLPACFDLFEQTAVRAETLRAYNVPVEADALKAFELGQRLPERSAQTNPWLARIRDTTRAGKAWSRYRLISWPLTTYERFQFHFGYPPSVKMGEKIWVADRAAHSDLGGLSDFWLFDAGTDQVFAALMFYDESGAYLGAEVTASPEVIDRCTDHLCLMARFAELLRA